MVSRNCTTLDLNEPVGLELFKTFVKNKISPILQTLQESDRFCESALRLMNQEGWLKVAVPRQYDGRETSTLELLWMARVLCQTSPGVFISFLGNTLGMSPIVFYGSSFLKERLLGNPEFSLWSFCMTEPQSGTDVASLRTRAVRDGDHFVINGEKCLITNSHLSNHLCVFATVDGTPKGITAFYVPAQASGVSRGKYLKKMGLKESNTGELFFKDVRVPINYMIGDVGQGLEILKHVIQRSKTLIAGGSIGICDRAFEIVQTQLTKRVRYGKSLLEKPAIRDLLAELQTDVEAAWLLSVKAAVTWDTGGFAVKEASMAKLFATDTAVRYVNEAIELLGGQGYSTELEIEKLYRDVKAFEIVEGASLVQKAIIAKEIIGAEKRPALRLLKAA